MLFALRVDMFWGWVMFQSPNCKTFSGAPLYRFIIKDISTGTDIFQFKTKNNKQQFDLFQHILFILNLSKVVRSLQLLCLSRGLVRETTQIKRLQVNWNNIKW